MSPLSEITPRLSGRSIRPAPCIQAITTRHIIELWWIAKAAATRGDDVNRSLEPFSEMFAVEYRPWRLELGLNYYPHTLVVRETHAILLKLHTFLHFVDNVIFLSTILQYLS